MIPIKIECGCGQRFAFELEPVGGEMPGAIACPACGVDGTVAANAAIARSIPAPGAPAATGTRLRVGAPAPASQPALAVAAAPSAPPPPRSARLPGQIEITQAKYEARAKISWGDTPASVVQFLRVQGMDAAEARSLVDELFLERAAAIRKNGMKKIIMGSGAVCVPIVAFLVFMSMRILPIKPFALTVMLGFWGLWTLSQGLFMFFAPKSEPGDVAKQ